MSKYTTDLRFICEAEAGLIESVGYNSVNDVIAAAVPKIFDFDFPIWDESYRNVLCTKIIKHYYTREIGLETYGLWKLKLETKLNEIMPYYNELYATTTYEYNPLYDVDYTRVTNGDESGENKRSNIKSGNNKRSGTVENDGSNIGSSNNVSKYSDTPQGALTGVLNDNYLTNVTVNDSSGSSQRADKTTYDVNDSTDNSENDIGNFSTTKEYIEHVAGKYPGGSFTKRIVEYRDAIINIDMLIIDSLSDLFMKVW